VPCPSCHDPDPRRAWERSRRLAVEARLVEESHFSVRLVRCAACGQAYANVFSERIDWAGGNDPQDWLVLPLDAEEARAIAGTAEDAVERALNALPPRPFLLRWFARDGETPELAWREGPIWVAPHD
jgi:hypothetical protein